MCETYGLAKEGARHHGYTGQRGYHPLLAIAAGTGDVLMSRLREGRANIVRGAAHFLRETVGRVRHAGATGQLTVRADSGFYAHALVVVCREMDVRFSITIRQHARLRELIEAISEEDWTPVPYWMDRGADVAETTYTPFQGEPEAAPVRLIVRRVKPTPGSQLALFTSLQLSRLHHRPGRGSLGTGGRPSPPRRDRECHPRPQARRRPQSSPPRAASPPTAPGWPSRCWPITWPAGPRASVWARGGDHQDPPAALLLPGRTAHPLGPPPHFASATGLALGNPVHSRPGSIASPAIACLTAPTAPDTSTRLPNRPTESHRPGPRLSSPACCPADPAPAPLPRTAIGAPNDNQRPPPAPFIGSSAGRRVPRPSPLVPTPRPLRIGGFGLRSCSSPALALGNPVHSRHGPAASHSTPRLTASLQLTQLPCKLVPPRSARVPCCVFSRHPAHRSSAEGHRGPMRRLKTVRRPPIYPNEPSHLPCSSLTHPAAVLTPSIGVLRWIRA